MNSHPDFHGNGAVRAGSGEELAGSAFTLWGEKTASLSENAQFQPPVVVIGSSQQGAQGAGPGHPRSGKDDKQGQRFSQKWGRPVSRTPGKNLWRQPELSCHLQSPLSLRHQPFRGPQMASCHGQASCFLQPLTARARAGWLASGAGPFSVLFRRFPATLSSPVTMCPRFTQDHFMSYISSFSVPQIH